MASSSSPTTIGLVTLTKFVGVASLGLLTGSSLSLSQHIPATLLAFPSPSTATKSFRLLQSSTQRTNSALTLASVSSLVIAYGLSPRGWRHPYLLWTALVTVGAGAAGGPTSWAVTWAKRKLGLEEEDLDEREIEEAREELENGEVVGERVQAWGNDTRWRGLGWGVAWGMGMLGLWGDGFVR